jgi:hypothetical protein
MQTSVNAPQGGRRTTRAPAHFVRNARAAPAVMDRARFPSRARYARSHEHLHSSLMHVNGVHSGLRYGHDLLAE